MVLLPTSPTIDLDETSKLPSSSEFPTQNINDSTPIVISPDKATNAIIFGSNNSQTSPSREYMTLTPVKLRNLESPLRNSVGQTQESKFSQSPLKLVSPTSKLYQDKFSIISKELEKLLENLNILYKKIGYSIPERKENEKLMFNTLSDNIKEFYMKAEEKVKKLSIDNEIEQQILNAMLERLNDSNGVNTIPDLYTRNAILLPQNRIVPDSPKKPLSLLEVHKSLNDAKEYVIKTYIPQLMKFLDENVKLQEIYDTIGEVLSDLTVDDEKLIKTLPNSKLSHQFIELFKNQQKDLSHLSNTIKENKKVLLFGDSFKFINSGIISSISRITDVYEKEYNIRVNNITEKIRQISNLIHDLELDMDIELSPAMQQIFQNYLQLNQSNSRFKSVTRDVLSTVETNLKKVQAIKDERINKKNGLMVECTELWEKLDLPHSHIDSIKMESEGLSLKSIDSLTVELGNLKLLKKKWIKQLVSNAWNKINEHWVTLQVDDSTKQMFVTQYDAMNLKTNSLQDDELLLEFCEREIKKLDAKLAIYAPVLKLIKDFQNLLMDKEFLEKSSKDSSRLLSRDSHKILLKEEKARKRITRHFPKIISELKNKLDDAEGIFQKPFVMNGKNLKDIIDEEETKFINRFPRSVLSLKRKRYNNDRQSTFNNKTKSDMGQTKPYSMHESPGHKDHKYRIHKPKTPTHKLSRSITERIIHSNDKLSSIKKTPISQRIRTTNIKSKSTGLKKRDGRYIVGTKSMTPGKQRSKLLSPTIISHKSKLHPSCAGPKGRRESNIAFKGRPYLQRSMSTSLSIDFNKVNNTVIDQTLIEKENDPNGVASGSKVGKIATIHGIRPTRLFPLNQNKLNTLHKSNIPVLFKSKSTLTGSVEDGLGDKGLMKHQASEHNPLSESPDRAFVQQRYISAPEQNLSPKVEPTGLSSPYRESNRSVYQLSMSPEGKFQLNIQQEQEQGHGYQGDDDQFHNTSVYNNNNDHFDDTSILEDDETDINFMEWKREQLIKLDSLKQRQQEQRTLSGLSTPHI